MKIQTDFVPVIVDLNENFYKIPLPFSDNGKSEFYWFINGKFGGLPISLEPAEDASNPLMITWIKGMVDGEEVSKVVQEAVREWFQKFK